VISSQALLSCACLEKANYYLLTAPDLEEISGGGLWRVPIDDAPVRDTRLAAIAVEQHPKGRDRHVLATRIRTVLSTVHHLHVDLRQPLEAEYRDLVA